MPIVEAFYKGVPVIARAATGAGHVGTAAALQHRRSIEVAGLIDAVVSDEALEDRVLRAQDAALALRASGLTAC